MRHAIAALFAFALVSHAVGSWAEPSSSESTAQQMGYGAGSVLSTLGYAPVKATVCILGGIGSALTAIVSPPKAGTLFEGSCGGTWVITPDALRGNEPVRFVAGPPASTATPEAGSGTRIAMNTIASE